MDKDDNEKREYTPSADDTAAYVDHGSFLANVKEQLRTWHAGRGERSALASIVPVPGRNRTHDVPSNPLMVLRNMTPLAWACFFCGWLAWMCDGYDYFTVPVTLVDLAEYFGKHDKDISWAMTVTTLCRAPGAVVFGILGDRYGRRWTLAANMLLIFVFELASGFCQTYEQFLGVRAAFGCIMGGTWPLAVATALENIPVEARGVASGIVQQGYAIGNLLAAVIGMTVGIQSKYTWRTLYFFGGGFSLLSAAVRLAVPESAQYRLAREHAKSEGLSEKERARHFWAELVAMIRTNWIRCLWCVFVMAGFCFLAHGSQDMYVTYLKRTKGLSPHKANTVSIISNCGAIVGGIIGGNMSQYLGRRPAIVISIFWTAAFIPLWILPKSFSGLAAGGFFLQWGVQSAWGVVPVYLSEVSPPAFRALFLGLFYQLGNMASGASGQIEAVVAARTKVPGTNTPDYAKIQGVFVGIVLAFTLTCIVLGPEADASHFEQAKVAYERGAGRTHADELIERDANHKRHRADKHAEEFVEDVERRPH